MKTLKGLILISFILLSLTAIGQLNYKKGYIITNENDTVYGKINDGGGKRNSKICLFKENNKQKGTKYYPKDIKGYRIAGEKYFASKKIEINGQPLDIFLEVLIKGKVSLYHSIQDRKMSFYIENDTSFIGLFHDAVLKYDHQENAKFLWGTKYYLYDDEYKYTLYLVFKDSKAIIDHIEQLRYDKRSLVEITKDYNTETCQNDNCINFEKNLKQYKPTVGLFTGVRMNQFSFMPHESSFYTISGFDETFRSNPIGISLNIPLQTLNDKLSLQIEVIYDQLKHFQKSTDSTFFNTPPIDISYKTLGLPVLLKYDLTHTKLTPSIAIGKELSYAFGSKVIRQEKKDLLIHNSQKDGWFFQTGLEYKIGFRSSIFANLRLQSFENLIVLPEGEKSPYDTLIDKEVYYKNYRNNFATLFLGIEF